MTFSASKVADLVIKPATDLSIAALSAQTTLLAQQGAIDSYNGALQSLLLKEQAIQQGLWSQVTKQADAQAGRAAKSAETWEQM